MLPERGQVWRNKRTKREATVLRAEMEGPHRGIEFRYRTPNPNSRATRMTNRRTNTTPISVDSFLQKFEIVGDGVSEYKKLLPTTPAHHPTQPLFVDENGTIRFRANALVRFLLDANGKIDMNMLARVPATDEERAHFAQLIGYSVSGWGDLSYVHDGCPEWLVEVDTLAAQITDEGERSK